MKLVTVSQAKSHLSAYIKSAEGGEQVVIMRGSKPAVCLRPVSESDLNLTTDLSSAAQTAFEKEVTRDRKRSSLLKLGNSASEAAVTLKRPLRKRK